MVGSFVSPKYTPQMAEIDEVMRRFTPEEGVKYVALILNEKGMRAREGVLAAAVTLREAAGLPRTVASVRHVHAPQHEHESQMQEMALAEDHRGGEGAGATEAGIATNADVRLEFPRRLLRRRGDEVPRRKQHAAVG